ncbi:Sphingolipid delta(4)-desaturase DES1-like [Gracilariopsis chorda]|uniref:Sphingolipid delta(4)-desaturase DES1-like n=1 Tax=Gracilariopsis chorda TaxID=448386 RepID=A0A2V3J6W5_9FLOR|nr:Sphingolipid delta(4)-desaturase DES1-like [Gracilariopsis chorda]|eukprot:PXF50139.1 Sphingolipid delta(4)-desaturase DES1-like [Gracilariopsis chorda]
MGKGGSSEEALVRNNELSTEAAEAIVHNKSGSKHPHADRRAEILRTHPEVAKLFGTYRGTAAWTLLLVSFQLALSVLACQYLPIWACVLLSYTVGAVVDHALWVLIHDATHNLVFKSVAMNRFVLLVCNIPHVFPSAMMFRYYHILHHIELNRAYRDPDVPFEWEAKFIGNSPFRKTVWLAFFFIVQALRTAFYTYRIPKGTELAWMSFNWVLNVVVLGTLVSYFGWAPLLFLAFSSISSIGLHPLGARWIQEHYPTLPFQATYSYYGIANRFAFAIGYHVEHHDFPSVPWNKLAVLKATAPEYYDTLFAYTSYSELLKDFIFERKWSLAKRYEVEREMSSKASPTADAFTKKER